MNKLEKNVFIAICRSRDIHCVGDSAEQSLGSKANARGASQKVCVNGSHTCFAKTTWV